MKYDFEPGVPVGLCGWDLLDWIDQSRDACTWPLNPPLTMPPMQRNGVWRPKQVLDLWKSMLNGLPIGLFYVQAVLANTEVVDPAERTELKKLDGRGWSLFDGQQRIRALALGAGDPFKEDRCIWVKFAGAKYELFISSRAQPAGYDAEGVKHRLDKRRDWATKNSPRASGQDGAPWWETAACPTGCSAEDTVKLASLVGQIVIKVMALRHDCRRPAPAGSTMWPT